MGLPFWLVGAVKGRRLIWVFIQEFQEFIILRYGDLILGNVKSRKRHGLILVLELAGRDFDHGAEILDGHIGSGHCFIDGKASGEGQCERERATEYHVASVFLFCFHHRFVHR